MDILDTSEEQFNVSDLIDVLKELQTSLQELIDSDDAYSGEVDELLETVEYLLEEIPENMSNEDFYAEKFEELKPDLEYVLAASVEIELMNDDMADELSRRKREENDEIEEW